MVVPRALLAPVVVVTMSCVATGASAQIAAAASDHHRAGVAYAKSGKWEQAVREFEEAYKLDPTPLRLYALGQVCFQAKQYVKARDAYAKIIDSPGLTPDQRQRARTGLADARSHIGRARIVVEDARPSDVITVDGVRVNVDAVELDPGAHVVRLVRDDEVAAETTVEVAPGAEAVATLGAREAAPPVDSKAAAAAAAAEEPSPPPALAWIFGGVAIAAVGTGAAFELVGYNEYRNVKDSGCEPRCGDREDAGRQKVLVGDVLIGAGLVSAVASAYFFLTARSDPSPTAAKGGAKARVDLGVGPVRSGGFVGLRGSF